MSAPAEHFPTLRRLTLPLPEVMRPRLRWHTSSREAAMEEILSLLAMTARCGGEPVAALRLTGQSEVEPLGSQPVVYTLELVFFFLLLVAVSLPPAPHCFIGLIFALPMLLTLRHASAGAHRIGRVRLVTAELAQMLADEMATGRTLSQAMAAHPRVFTRAQVALVRSGEHSGDLGGALRCLSREVGVRQRGRVLDALRIYFIVVLSVFVIIASFVLERIYPRFVDIFTQLDLEIPTLAQRLTAWTSQIAPLPSLSFSLLLLIFILCFFADLFTRQHMGRLASAVICFGLIIILIPIANLSSRQLGGTLFVFGLGPTYVASGLHPSMAVFYYPFQTALLLLLCAVLPFLFDLVRGGFAALGSGIALLVPNLRRSRASLERANFFSALGLMLERKMPAPEALRLAAPALAPAGLQRSAERSAQMVERGTSLFDALRRLRLIRRREEVLLRVAARGNQVAERCHAIAADLAEEARQRIELLERMLRPVVVLAVASLALVLLLAIYVPLFSIAVSVLPQ